jgi:hypothetical protein
MNTTKTLILAAFAAMSVGMGAAMAQENAGGDGSYEARELARLNRVLMSKVATPLHHEPQAGSSDYSTANNSTVLLGGDGNGR